MSKIYEQRCLMDDGKTIIHREKASRRLEKCRITGTNPRDGFVPPWDDWENDLYYGSLRRYSEGAPFGPLLPGGRGIGGPYAIIGITAKNESALHDWRDFQRIKNDLVGEEWEAVELYPAESRLVDPSNRFYLWCFPPGVLSALGFPTRIVKPPLEGGAPQRPFPEGA